MRFLLMCLLFVSCDALPATQRQCDADLVSCASTSKNVTEEENAEGEVVRLQLLQKHVDRPRKNTPRIDDDIHFQHLESGGGAHLYLLVRPCARFAGDGMSGLPRMRVTGECCGNAVCSSAHYENGDTCPQDCSAAASPQQSTFKNERLLPPTSTSLFGLLDGMEHEEYHCQDTYGTEQQTKCSHDRTVSVWLELLLERAKSGTLPFDVPSRGSVALELGCGTGQDSRNMASLAGWTVTSVDVSPVAIEQAKQTTPPEMQGLGAGQIEFVAYDAMALPAPKKRIDFLFDATVYCGLRHKYLARDYELWSRIATPGHTLVNIQCMNWPVSDDSPTPVSKRDMEADFEPVFDVLHSEECVKNQGRIGWCFFLRLKDPEVQKQSAENRLRLQNAARDGDLHYLRSHLHEGIGDVVKSANMTLYQIAQANNQVAIMRYLSSTESDPFFNELYGLDAQEETVNAEDRHAGSESTMARRTQEQLKAAWEKAEAMEQVRFFKEEAMEEHIKTIRDR